ncbi:hypothetical protein HJD18_10695 [Thermoleophilia bacterium SCSIO 60948]|nr:hypothetical protein HJD18_10695 [Thermoleophilia bacterium SCSIO 60948]
MLSRDRNNDAPPRLVALMSFQPLTSRRLPIALVAGLVLAAIAAVVAFASLGGSADGAKSKVLGKPNAKNGQQCEAKDNRPDNKDPKCFVIVSVTGVQVLADGKRNAFKAPSAGRIVAYGMSLGRPQKELRQELASNYSGGKFDGKATSQLAILEGGKKGRFKLRSKSRDFKAESFLNRDPIVALAKPLRVRKGDFIGLTTPSWLPVLGSESDSQRWRGSQKAESRKDCARTSTLKQSKPLRKEGSARRFRCSFGARLLYWAYFEPKGDGDGGGGGNNKIQTLGAAPANAPAANDLPSGGIAP